MRSLSVDPKVKHDVPRDWSDCDKFNMKNVTLEIKINVWSLSGLSEGVENACVCTLNTDTHTYTHTP